MAFGVYVHIPYCLQRCRYCDFTTFEESQLPPPKHYVNLVIQEIRARQKDVRHRKLTSLYFGGGTPSLIPAELIVAIVQELANAGFEIPHDAETTIEINPATIDEKKLDQYLAAGINRFSVGAQTFNDPLLKACGRKHTADDTRATLKLLLNRRLNYSFDLLFALPGQTLQDLERDIDEALNFDPQHISAYCLTVPEGHPMASGRAPEDEQVEMFNVIENRLAAEGIHKYEISNFARPGFESRHNLLYWTDQSYWGLGLSAHSYFRDLGRGGVRFWNPKSLEEYEKQVFSAPRTMFGLGPHEFLPATQVEFLQTHENMTDFCHIYLRLMSGLPEAALRQKFSPFLAELIEVRLDSLVRRNLLEKKAAHWRLTREGQLLSNEIFRELTFMLADFAAFRPAADQHPH